MSKAFCGLLCIGYDQPSGGYDPRRGQEPYPPAGHYYGPAPIQPPAPGPYPAYRQPYAYPPYRSPFPPIRPYISLIVITMIAMIFMIASVATPWYGMYSKDSNYSGKVEISFWDMRSEATSHGSTFTSTETWSKYTENYKDSHDKEPSLPYLYLAIQIFMIIGMVISILAFVSVVLTWFGKGPFALRSNVSGFLIATVIMGLFCIIAFAAAHSWVFDQDMPSNSSWGPHKTVIGMHSEGGEDSFWSVTTGWILALVGSILMIVAYILLRKRAYMAAMATSGFPAQAVPVAPGYYQLPPEPGYAPPPGPPGYYPPQQ